jgi:hypothetical protein
LPAARAAQTHTIGHQMLNHFFLHDLGNEVKAFCSPSAMEMVDGEWVMVARFDRCFTMVKAVSSEAPALGTALVAAVRMGGPPPSNDSAWEASVR